MSYDTMLYEGAQKNIRETDKNGHDFSLVKCEHCGSMGSVHFHMTRVETKYDKVYVHHFCENEYLKNINE